jgi:hypothetical protein
MKIKVYHFETHLQGFSSTVIKTPGLAYFPWALWIFNKNSLLVAEICIILYKTVLVLKTSQ